MTSGEWITLIGIIIGVIIAILGGTASVVGGLIWWFVTREVRRFETGMTDLTKAVSDATVEMRELKVEVKSVREDHHNIWTEINRLKENRHS